MPSTDEQYAQEVEQRGDQVEASIAAAVQALLATENEPTEEQYRQVISGIVIAYVLGLLALMHSYAPNKDSSAEDWDLIAEDAVHAAARHLHEAMQHSDAGPARFNISDTARLKAIVSSVVTSITSQVGEAIAGAFGFEAKRWYTRLDGKVRPSHRLLEGETVPLGTSFQLPTGVQLRFPGDPLAPLTETAGCRCRVGYVIRVPEQRELEIA